MDQTAWRRAKEALADALDQPTAYRDEFVQQRCSAPEELAEVRMLLREYEAAPGFLEEPTSVFDVLASVETNDPRLAEALQVFGAYGCPFADLSFDALQALVSETHLREYKAGERVITQGEKGDCVLIILRGTATARVRDAPADRVPVGEFGPGDIVGEMSLVTDEPRTADVVAGSAVRTLVLPSAAFDRVSERYPEVRVLLTDVLADRLGRATFDGLGGKDIGGYRITRCVGRGGMGVVYEARKLASDQIVALKMMNHRLLYHAGAVTRFRREAATLGTLDHASIPRLYECFEAYRTQFLAMQFCEGSTLTEVVAARGPLVEPVVRRMVGQLASALRYVHGHGVVHRDLKPSNVMIGRSGVVQLLDFGIVTSAHSTGMASGPDDGGGDATVFAGTPRYMAPEQFSPGKSDHRVDYYGLACVAYEALSGQPAIAGTDLVTAIRDKLRFVLPPAPMIGLGVSADMYELLRCGLDYLPAGRTLDLERLAAWAGPVEIGEQ